VTARQPRGTTTGGRFAATQRAEGDVDLDSDRDCLECSHPRSAHSGTFVPDDTSCQHDLDADYDDEKGRFVKVGGCDCPAFV